MTTNNQLTKLKIFTQMHQCPEQTLKTIKIGHVHMNIRKSRDSKDKTIQFVKQLQAIIQMQGN